MHTNQLKVFKNEQGENSLINNVLGVHFVFILRVHACSSMFALPENEHRGRLVIRSLSASQKTRAAKLRRFGVLVPSGFHRAGIVASI